MNQLSKIQAVTFDVGGTLIAPWPSVGAVYAEVAARHGVKNLSPEILNQQFGSAWRVKKQFDHSKAAWREIVNATFAGFMEPTEYLFEDLYHRFTEPECWRVFDDAKPTFEFLRKRGIKLGAISNWDERLRPLLDALDLAHFFQAIVVSFECGCVKPAPKIFQRAADLLQLPAAAVLHVGDRFEEDYQGARDIGITCVLIHRNEKTAAQEICSLSDLAVILETGGQKQDSN